VLEAASRLGPYEIVAPLGAGGMGEVYRARDTRLGREVAVKVLPEPFARDPDRLARFEREARAVAALSHPNILAIHDYGTHGAVTYLVMELLEGQTLRSRLAKRALPWREAIEVGGAVADGLAAAHLKGIIHRDVKPENLFLTSDGRVKILDFGLARVETKSPVGSETGPYLPAQTDPGTVMGTVGYMSPEQIRGLIVDARSDIFSLGCVLYEMVSGRRPFQRKTVADTSAAILHDEPRDLANLGIQAPPGVEHAIRLCLAKRPADRFPSAQECASALRAVLSESGESQGLLPTRPLGKQAQPRRRKAIDSLAILPLANASGDANSDYLSDGMTESIINMLSRLPKLRVMARSTVFRYKGRDVDLQEVGRTLNVRAVLSGRVLQQGRRLVVNTELVDVADGAQLWGEHYDRALSEILAVEEAIAQEITAKLRPRLTGDQKKPLRRACTTNTEAYQLYLKGRYHWNKRSEEGFRKSIQHFEQAIEQDPAFALAWAGLADAYHQLGCWGNVVPHDACLKAEAAARKALEFDPALAEAHASLGTIKREYSYDLAGAERDFQRAIELNPNYATAHHWYGECLGCMGRHAQAIAELQRAQQLDPLSLIINAALGRHGYFFARQHDRAIDQCLKTLEMDSGFWVAHMFLGLIYAHTGQHGEALAEFQKARVLDDNVEILAGLGFAYGLSGQRAEAEKALGELLAMSKQRYVMSISIALVYTGLGDKDQAFAWLAKAYENRNGWLSEIKADPTFDSLRSDPRFAQLLKNIGLPP
jgi:serine/threonine protein kinase/Tfp pilus assembly protein PilF